MNSDTKENYSFIPNRKGVDPWHLPECLRDLAPQTLWYAVAQYGKMLGHPICRKEISEAFKITPRRAGDVLAYILRYCKKTITCKAYIKHHDRAQKELYVHIYKIASPQKNVGIVQSSQHANIDIKSTKPSKGRAIQRKEASELAKAFLRRPVNTKL